MLNRFDNDKVVPWYYWLIRRKSESKAVVIYFLSRIYGTSPRFFPLYNHFKDTDIILFRGSRFPGIDRLYLKILPHFIRIFSRKLSSYSNFIALNSDPSLVIRTNMILNIDDPTYTTEESNKIKSWESKINEFGFQSIIVCTTQYIREYLISAGIKSKIFIIAQGHANLEFAKKAKVVSGKDSWNFVYISPTIDVKGDPHEGHNMWDASTLLFDIWPQVKSTNSQLHLIGRLGRNASICLADERIKTHGLLSVQECAKLLSSFDVALYPRVHDNAWLPQKLIEYVGAGLPILAFDLVDTRIVRDLNVGTLVKSAAEFAHMIDEISHMSISFETFHENAIASRHNYSWSHLANKFELIYF